MHELKLLTSILAGTDGLWLPNRTPTAKHAGPLWTARQQYHQRGVAWKSDRIGGVDDSTRKAAQRLLDRAIDADHVRPYGDKGRREFVKLTDEGEHLVRTAIGLPTLDDCSVIRDMRRAIEAGQFATHLGKQWIPETHLSGAKYGDSDAKDKFIDLEDSMLPWMARGWIVSGASVQGAVWYRVTDKASTGELAAIDVAYDDELRAFYFDRLRIEQAELKHADTTSEIGSLPLPASMAIGNHFGAGAAR